MTIPLSIAVYSHYFSPEIGAPSARIYDLSCQWLKTNNTVRVVTCVPNHPTGKVADGYRRGWYQQETLSGVDVHRNWSYITPNSGFFKKTLGHLSLLPSSLVNLRRLGKVDVIIGTSPTPFAALAGLLAAKQRKVPFVLEIRDLWPAIFAEMGIIKNKHIIRLLEWGELWLYRQSTQIVTVTEAFRQDLIRRNIPAQKITTIRNSADTEFWQPQPKPLALEKELNLEEKFVVLYIGAHGSSHALESILDAAQKVADNKTIRFLFVGEGSRKTALQSYAKEKQLTNVTFLDATDKQGVKAYYSLADVCLVPLRDIPLFNGFIPSKMFEIMAMEKPIVASLNGEAAEILKEAQSAEIVAPEDSTAIAKAILAIQADPVHAKKLGKRGREFVESNCSRKHSADRYLNVLRDAIEIYNGDGSL